MKFSGAMQALEQGKSVAYPELAGAGYRLAADDEGTVMRIPARDTDMRRASIWHPEPLHLMRDDWFVVDE